MDTSNKINQPYNIRRFLGLSLTFHNQTTTQSELIFPSNTRIFQLTSSLLRKPVSISFNFNGRRLVLKRKKSNHTKIYLQSLPSEKPLSIMIKLNLSWKITKCGVKIACTNVAELRLHGLRKTCYRSICYRSMLQIHFKKPFLPETCGTWAVINIFASFIFYWAKFCRILLYGSKLVLALNVASFWKITIFYQQIF